MHSGQWSVVSGLPGLRLRRRRKRRKGTRTKGRVAVVSNWSVQFRLDGSFIIVRWLSTSGSSRQHDEASKAPGKEIASASGRDATRDSRNKRKGKRATSFSFSLSLSLADLATNQFDGIEARLGLREAHSGDEPCDCLAAVVAAAAAHSQGGRT